MILISIATYKCSKCYSTLIYTIEKKHNTPDFDQDLVVFKHPPFDGHKCVDEGKILASLGITNFLISDFHNDET